MAQPTNYQAQDEDAQIAESIINERSIKYLFKTKIDLQQILSTKLHCTVYVEDVTHHKLTLSMHYVKVGYTFAVYAEYVIIRHVKFQTLGLEYWHIMEYTAESGTELIKKEDYIMSLTNHSRLMIERIPDTIYVDNRKKTIIANVAKIDLDYTNCYHKKDSCYIQNFWVKVDEERTIHRTYEDGDDDVSGYTASLLDTVCCRMRRGTVIIQNKIHICVSDFDGQQIGKFNMKIDIDPEPFVDIAFRNGDTKILL